MFQTILSETPLQTNLFNSGFQEIGQSVKDADYSKLKDLIAEGWRAFYTEMFGKRFTDALDSIETDDRHHSEALEWHWNARIALIQCELELRKLQTLQMIGAITPEVYSKMEMDLRTKWYPKFWAYTAIWARGNMKTTLARFMVVTDALLSLAHGVKSYALIVGGTVKKVKGTAATIGGELLQTPKIKEYAPKLAQVKKNDGGQSQGWTADFINTAAGCIFHFIGLDQGVAGANVEGIRPTFIIPDDVDDREDSPVISDSRLSVLTRGVIPTKQWNTMFFFAQNLISRFSILYRIYKQQVRVLANRFATKPIPAVRNPVFEEGIDPDSGLIRDYFISGEITWRGWNRMEVQNQVDTMTLPVFMLECQHEVEANKEGLVHKKYKDDIHPVSYSQLHAKFGSRDAWKTMNKIPISDWARTKTKYHANVAAYVCVANQNSPLPGHIFIVPYSFKADTAPEDVACRLLSELTPYAVEQCEEFPEGKLWKDLVEEAWTRAGEHNFTDVSERSDFLRKYYVQLIPKYSRPILRKFRVKTGVNSHSEDKVRDMLNQGFGFSFIPSNPTEHEGLEEIDQMQRVLMKEPHCFDDSKMGYTRFHVLCPDDTTKEPTMVNGIAVYPPKPYPDVMEPNKLHDSDLFRYQMCNRMFAAPELGKYGETIDKLMKADDDFGQSLQMLVIKKLLSNVALSKEEKIEESLPKGLTEEAIAALPEIDEAGRDIKSLTLQARYKRIKENQREGNKRVLPASLARRRKR